MASRRPEKKPLTHRPFAALNSAVRELEDLGYAPCPSSPQQKGSVDGDKKNGKKRKLR